MEVFVNWEIFTYKQNIITCNTHSSVYITVITHTTEPCYWIFATLILIMWNENLESLPSLTSCFIFAHISLRMIVMTVNPEYETDMIYGQPARLETPGLKYWHNMVSPCRHHNTYRMSVYGNSICSFSPDE